MMEKCNLGSIMASSFFGKVVWRWCMNEVEKLKGTVFQVKKYFYSGRDLKLLRSCVFNWT